VAQLEETAPEANPQRLDEAHYTAEPLEEWTQAQSARARAHDELVAAKEAYAKDPSESNASRVQASRDRYLAHKDIVGAARARYDSNRHLYMARTQANYLQRQLDADPTNTELQQQLTDARAWEAAEANNLGPERVARIQANEQAAGRNVRSSGVVPAGETPPADPFPAASGDR
jgi:hypothetical protein